MPITITLPTEFVDAIADAVAAKLEDRLQASRPEAPARDPYLTRDQVAGLLGITKPTIHAWMKQGKLKAHRIGRRVYFKPEDLDRAMTEARYKK